VQNLDPDTQAMPPHLSHRIYPHRFLGVAAVVSQLKFVLSATIIEVVLHDLWTAAGLPRSSTEVAELYFAETATEALGLAMWPKKGERYRLT
jgi:hypothetical protein